METETVETENTRQVALMGNGTALHLVDARGILCNRWGSTNGTVRAPRIVEGATPTCKRCVRLAATEPEPEPAGNVVPIRPNAELAAYSTSALLQAIITLTHCVSGSDRDGNHDKADEYRARREVALAEVQRRTGER